MTATPMTATSLALFLDLARDACNWSGNPPINGNVRMDAALRGNLTDLKRRKLLGTWTDEGVTWVEFTAEGIALAAEHGVTL